MLKVLTIANNKGGVGKSTCAAHLALEATKNGLKTLLIDLDPQQSLEKWWNKRVDEEPFLAEVKIEELVDDIKYVNSIGFDFCIIDTPRDLKESILAAIQVADLVLIPCKPTTPDLQAVGRTIAMVKKEKKQFIFLLTQVINRTSAALEATSILSEFGPVVPTTINNKIAYANAMNSGRSASLIDNTTIKELDTAWNFISNRLFNNQDKDNGLINITNNTQKLINTQPNSDTNKLKSKQGKNILVNLTCKIPESKRIKYKIWCVENRIKMNEAMIQAFDLLIKKDT